MCARGECFCDTTLGYGGKDCSEPLCKNMCSGHGECVGENRQCDCEEGWGGDDCSERACPINCSNHGVCAPGGFCVCLGGFSGLACDQRTCESDCSGRGECNNGTCFCQHGFTGNDCSVVVCPNDCSSRGRCMNGTCICAKNWLGDDCSVMDCVHGKFIPAAHKCACDDGWDGEWCDKNNTASACMNGCNGHGTCKVETGLCNCLDGFTGALCGIVVCPNDCSGHGICGSYGCRCHQGWTGLVCSTLAEDPVIGLNSVQRHGNFLRSQSDKNRDVVEDRLIHGHTPGKSDASNALLQSN